MGLLAGYFQYNLPYGILSIPFGGGGGRKHNWVENEFDRLSLYEDIYLCFDNDEEGQAATRELISRLGRHRCKIVALPYKDANECLQKGVPEDEIKRCFELATPMDPDELRSASSFADQVVKEFYSPNQTHFGYTLPWEKTHGKITLGRDELSIWTGINGHGKSQILGHIILNCMQQGAKVCIASLEIKPQKLLMRLTRQASGLRNPTEEYIKYIHSWYADKLWIFDLVGTAKTERILEVFQYARQRYGIDTFVIDSFMKCGLDEDDYNRQKKFIEQLCDFKNEFNCHVHLVVHPRKLLDESKLPGKLDVKGSGSVTDLADNCFTIWRNKVKEDEIRKLPFGSTPTLDISQKYDALLRCEKQRNGEWEGAITLWFDIDSFQFLGSCTSKPKQIVDWSNIK